MTCDRVTRRQSLARLGGLAGGTFGLSAAVPATERLKAVSFSVVTDTHLGYRGNDGALRRWEQTVEDLAKDPGAFVLHLGDLVDGGRVEQYTPYKSVRQKIGKPVYEIPGNHDPADAFAKHIRKQIDTTFDHGWLTCILMNNAHRDSHDGFFTDAQLDWLSSRCAKAARAKRRILVACHVPVHTNRPPDRAWYVKPKHGQQRFYDILAEHGNRVVGLFHGHFHNGLRGWRDRSPLHEICFPSALYNQNRGLEAKNAPGYNPEEFRPGFCRVTIGNGKLNVVYHPTGQPSTVSKSLPSI